MNDIQVVTICSKHFEGLRLRNADAFGTTNDWNTFSAVHLLQLHQTEMVVYACICICHIIPFVIWYVWEWDGMRVFIYIYIVMSLEDGAHQLEAKWWPSYKRRADWSWRHHFGDRFRAFPDIIVVLEIYKSFWNNQTFQRWSRLRWAVSRFRWGKRALWQQRVDAVKTSVYASCIAVGWIPIRGPTCSTRCKLYVTRKPAVAGSDAAERGGIWLGPCFSEAGGIVSATIPEQISLGGYSHSHAVHQKKEAWQLRQHVRKTRGGIGNVLQ